MKLNKAFPSSLCIWIELCCLLVGQSSLPMFSKQVGCLSNQPEYCRVSGQHPLGYRFDKQDWTSKRAMIFAPRRDCDIQMKPKNSQVCIIAVLVGFQSCFAVLQRSFVLPLCQLLLGRFEAGLYAGHAASGTTSRISSPHDQLWKHSTMGQRTGKVSAVIHKLSMQATLLRQGRARLLRYQRERWNWFCTLGHFLQ